MRLHFVGDNARWLLVRLLIIIWIIWCVGIKPFELNDEQSPQVDIILDKALAWHRTNELPQYLAQLREIRAQILEQSMTQEQIAAHQERAFAHWVRVRKYLASDVSTIAMSLDTDQMSTLFVKLTKDREEEQVDFARRQSKQPDRAERIIESFAERMGYVTDAQADLCDGT